MYEKIKIIINIKKKGIKTNSYSMKNEVEILSYGISIVLKLKLDRSNLIWNTKKYNYVYFIY